MCFRCRVITALLAQKGPSVRGKTGGGWGGEGTYGEGFDPSGYRFSSGPACPFSRSSSSPEGKSSGLSLCWLPPVDSRGRGLFSGTGRADFSGGFMLI